MVMATGRKASRQGCLMGDGLLIGLVIAVLVFSGYAVFHYTDHRHPATNVTFNQWYENKSGYDQALLMQKRTHLPLLVYIFASWCPHCKEFKANILNAPSVRRFLSQYPHVRVEPDHGDAERQIMSDYQAPGYPSFYVVSPQGTRYHIDTFVSIPEVRPKTPEEFLQSLRETIGAFMRQ